MPQSEHPLIDARRDQMFPVLEPAEIDRLARFGARKSYAAGERIIATGEIAPGAFVILRGRVVVTQRGVLGQSQPIVTLGRALATIGAPSYYQSNPRSAVRSATAKQSRRSKTS